MINARSASVVALCCLAALSAVAADPVPAPAGQTPAANLYWPGDFESHLFGGAYSNNLKVTLCREANHTPGGAGAWEIKKGYQHLELLVPGHAAYQLSFWAKSPQPLAMGLKVISRIKAAAEEKDPARQMGEVVHEIKLEGGPDWREYRVDFKTVEPFPGPVLTEILLTCYNGAEVSTFVDDLVVCPLPDAKAKPAEKAAQFVATDAVRNGDFEQGADGTSWMVPDGGKLSPLPEAAVVADAKLREGHVLVLGKAGNPKAAASMADQAIPAGKLAGQRIRISADVAFLSNAMPVEAWNGVLFVLSTDSADGKQIGPTPNPFWYTISLAEPAGKFRVISAVYDIPADVQTLYLRAMVQPGVGDNLAAIDNLRIDRLP